MPPKRQGQTDTHAIAEARARLTRGASLHVVSLSPTRRDPGRIAIRITPVSGDPAGADDQTNDASSGRPAYLATLADTSIHELGLTIGSPVTDSLLDTLEPRVGRDRALRSALARVGRRDFSSGMLRDRLRRAGHPTEAADAAVQRLAELGLIDDDAFADALIREARRSRPAGDRLLRQKLFTKGLPAPVIDAALARSQPAPDEVAEAAAEFAIRESRKMIRLAPEVRRRRLYGRLARRGFDGDVIRNAMQAANADASDPGD